MLLDQRGFQQQRGLAVDADHPATLKIQPVDGLACHLLNGARFTALGFVEQSRRTLDNEGLPFENALMRYGG